MSLPSSSRRETAWGRRSPAISAANLQLNNVCLERRGRGEERGRGKREEREGRREGGEREREGINKIWTHIYVASFSGSRV